MWITNLMNDGEGGDEHVVEKCSVEVPSCVTG